jgi:ferredoxin-like protein FixX
MLWHNRPMAAARRAKNPGVGRGNWRAVDLPDNAVTRTVQDRCKGAANAARIAQTTPTTVYDWCRKGAVRVSSAACLLAAACEPKSAAKQLALVRALAGLDD